MDEVMSGSTDEQDAADPVADVPAEVGFTGRRTAEIVGISYRQLDYWARTGLVTPSLAEARGSGSRRHSVTVGFFPV